MIEYICQLYSLSLSSSPSSSVSTNPSVCLFAHFLFELFGFILLIYMHHSYMWILSTKRTNLIRLECRIIYVPEFLENDTTRITGGNSWVVYLTVNKCCCSVTQSCPTLCDPMDCSTPGFPVIHYLLKSAQTLVHWVGGTIQLSCPLLCPSPPAFSLSQHPGLFQWVSSSHQAPLVCFCFYFFCFGRLT